MDERDKTIEALTKSPEEARACNKAERHDFDAYRNKMANLDIICAELEKRVAEQGAMIEKMKAYTDGMEFVLNRIGNPSWQSPAIF